jgi:hypothetical protein
MGCVILQKKEDGTWSGPTAYFSRKLSDAQRKYTVLEQELLSIVENLKTLRTMLLGQVLIIYTDHNVVAEALSRLPMSAELLIPPSDLE